jgi:uncharacterized integral membrane protein
MRLLRILLALAFVALGVAVGALNPQPVVLDLGFTGLAAGLGVMVLAALLVGALCGGLVLALGVVLPLRRALKHERAGEQAPRPPYDMGV